MQPRIADVEMIIREAVESRDESAFHRFAEILVGGLVELERRQQEIQSAPQTEARSELLVIVELIKEGFRAQEKRFEDLRIYMETRFEALIVSAQEDARRQEKRFEALIVSAQEDARRQEKRFEEQAKRSDELRADMNARTDELRTDMNARTDELRTDIKARTDELRTDMNARTDELRADIKARTDELRADMNARTDELRADMKADRKEQANRTKHRDHILMAACTLLFTEIGIGIAIIGVLIGRGS